MKYTGKANEFLRLTDLNEDNKNLIFEVNESDLTIIWNTDSPLSIVIDNIEYQLLKNEMIFLTEFHKIDSINFQSARLVRFNRPFYCIIDHDTEVSCKGLLFFGASNVPIVSISDEEFEKFDVLWKMFRLEMTSKDNLQVDMLQIMLQRLLILSVRSYKNTIQFDKLDKSQLDIVREFNFLVESNFLKHHDVAYYASLLNKSPKTLSNLFSIVSKKTPLNIIHDRIMLDARKRILYTDKSIKEIAYDLGYEDIQTFSRFFKNKEGISPIEYRVKFKNSK
ncbi:helix-turn-helix domain-containing protein [Flavobacterium soyangense]|uniref:Helix-turn-helix domain-containing protein n=1 Tax=Flavobacterium soyangense TaxID=2023265 RepID=A0A930UFE2_9FLAO|nr:helix-turn-helix domain-containing protein [Flavobacterium soyangense]MBF2709450.1 helix-turn-helix domain-containing protein [Flavobacterium soyangense]